MMRLPEQLRKMTLRDIQKTWDGNMMKTVERMQREVMERDAAEKREREEAERREKEGAKRYVRDLLTTRILLKPSAKAT